MNRALPRRIVCAVDLSDRSVPSLKRALQLAPLHGAELFVVHVANAGVASPVDWRRRYSGARDREDDGVPSARDSAEARGEYGEAVSGDSLRRVVGAIHGLFLVRLADQDSSSA